MSWKLIIRASEQILTVAKIRQIINQGFIIHCSSNFKYLVSAFADLSSTKYISLTHITIKYLKSEKNN